MNGINEILLVFVMIAIPVGIVLGFILNHYWKKESKSLKITLDFHTVVLKCVNYVPVYGNTLKNFLENHHTLLQYLEYGSIGALGTGVNALIYFPLIVHIGNEASWLIGIIGAFTFNFFLNKYLVFKE